MPTFFFDQDKVSLEDCDLILTFLAYLGFSVFEMLGVLQIPTDWLALKFDRV